MSDLQLKDEIMTIFLAGHETTSNALTWTFYLLSQHPTAEARLYAAYLPRFSYFPFGGGIRGCVGEPFAWMEGILLLTTICREWKMHHDGDHKVELKPLITLRPKYGMRMKLERRK